MKKFDFIGILPAAAGAVIAVCSTRSTPPSACAYVPPIDAGGAPVASSARATAAEGVAEAAAAGGIDAIDVMQGKEACSGLEWGLK